MPGRARNSSHTAAAIAPSSENKKRLRLNPSDAGCVSEAIHNATTAPTTHPIVPAMTVAENERRTPSTRPMNALASNAKPNAGTSNHSSSPSRSNTEAASVVVMGAPASRARSELLHLELALCVLRAQDLLVELADARLGHFGDEGPAL